MKQRLRNDIVLNLLMLLVLGKFSPQAGATETTSDLPATTVTEWRSAKGSTARSQIRQGATLSQINNYPAIVTEIEVRSIIDGIKIVLTTADGEQLQGITSTEGNNLIIDIPNARLDSPEEDKLRENPAEGIASVRVSSLDAHNVRVIVTGMGGTPIGETITTSQGITISAIPTVADAEAPDEVIDIIVTAQKQPESLQDVPISITTFSQEEIEDARIDSFRDVAANTPNFYTTLGDRTFNFQTIRGLGNAGFLTRDSISFFIDDVPYENVHQLLPGALFDLERVEVLRGPQGTLYGRNSQAGPQESRFSAAAAFFGIDAFGASITQGRFDQTAFAVFAQIDFKLIDPLTLTAGLRYENTDEELERRFFTVFEGDNSAEDNTPFVNSTVEDDVFIPKFAIQYDFNPNIATYASITRGYKPPTQNYTTDDPTLREVNPEKSWNYEIGVKSSWFGDRLTLNIAGFINDVSDLQVPLTGDTGFFEDITNAEALIKGFEIEAKAVPVTGLDLIAGFGYTDAEYTEYFNPFTGEDFDGNQLVYAPEFTYNLAIQYRARFGLFSRVELQGLGNNFFDDNNSLKQESFALVNTRIGYETQGYGIYFYVNNLFDEEYITAAFASAGTTLASYGDRRTFSVQVKSEF